MIKNSLGYLDIDLKRPMKWLARAGKELPNLPSEQPGKFYDTLN
jgi:hypothetical protein